MATTKPYVPTSDAPLSVPTLCTCVHFTSEECLSRRWQIDMPLAEILHGCPCRCHFTSSGAYMPAGAWHAARVRIQRDSERVKSLNEVRARKHANKEIHQS